MKSCFFAGVFSAVAVLTSVTPASAQYPVIPPAGIGCNPASFAPHGAPCPHIAGCRGFCLNAFSKIHFHGPLVNYGPYHGYYPFEPYGPWTSNLQYNPPPVQRHHWGHDRAWRQYSLHTLKNVFDRFQPLRHKCGKGGWSNCSNCGTEPGCTGCASAPGAAAITIPQIPGTSVAAGAD